MIAYKLFSHKLCSPIRRGEPVWDGHVPFDLPSVPVDKSDEECAAGWNACADAAMALQIGGLWRDGWPARLFRLNDRTPILIRDKLRAATWRIEEEVSVEPGVKKLADAFAPFSGRMGKAMMAWYTALGRPLYSPSKVAASLRKALKTRGLTWTIKQLDTAKAAWVAGDLEDCGYYEGAWDAWAAGHAWTSIKQRGDIASDAMQAWTADSRNRVDARAASNAWAALVVQFAGLQKWTHMDPLLLTTGIREAYRYGLHLALPIGPTTLGWAMIERK